MEVAIYLREKLRDKLPIVGELLIKDRKIEQVKDIICSEVDQFIPRIMEEFTTRLDRVDIENIVYQKVANFSNEKLEELLMGVLKKELKFIELAGAVLGFFIGLIQVILVKMTM